MSHSGTVVAERRRLVPPSGSARRAPEGREANWIQTVPGKGWFPILRLYGPLEPWFDKTWLPGDITPV